MKKVRHQYHAFLCNERVKFDDLFDVAKDLNADALVTGHYINSVEGKNGREMYRAKDIERDQSYFLFKTTREQLNFLRFPLGNFTKSEIRKIAEDIGLEVSEKPDSQDICFVPDGKYADVVRKLKPGSIDIGDIIDVEGKKLGQHNGIIDYTIGQRKGIGIGGRKGVNDKDTLLYVIALDAQKNQVIVGSKGLFSLVKKIKNYFRELYIKLSYKPLDQEELTSVLRDAEENNVIDKGILGMIEETIEFSSIPVRDVMVPRSQMILINDNDSLDILLKKSR